MAFVLFGLSVAPEGRIIFAVLVGRIVKISVFRPPRLAPFEAVETFVIVEPVIILPASPGVFPAFSVFALLLIQFLECVLQIVKHSWSFPSFVLFMVSLNTPKA
jgi:hypothetical protein